MVNIKQKVSSSEECFNGGLTSEIEEIKNSCVDCHTTTTPLWRGGPAGRKTLCNACGIRQMKIRKALGIDSEAQRKSKKKKKSNSNSNKVKSPWKMRLMGLGRKWVLKKSTVTTKWYEKKMSQMGEEEQAAVLLMALSCRSFFF